MGWDTALGIQQWTDLRGIPAGVCTSVRENDKVDM